MKTPLPIGNGELSSIICAMLRERGLDSFTLPLEDFERLNLGAYGLECEGEFANEDDDIPTSMTVTIRKM